jgi:hypothetical protein
MRLSELRHQLRTLFIGDWSGILLNPNYVQQGHIMTWNNYHSMMMPEPLTFKDVARLYTTGQYSLQLALDGSIFQFYYAYDQRNRVIQEARIAYYEANGSGMGAESSGVPPSETKDPEPPVEGPLPALDLQDTHYRGFDDRQPRWFRIDFRSQSPKCVLHNNCHLHFGGFPGSRLVVAGLPTPRQFVEFVLCCCYSDIYERFRLDGTGKYLDERRIHSVNSTRIPVEPNPVFRQITHLRIPGM